MRKKKCGKRRQRLRNWKSGIKAGCLALGMATAWGGEARGEVISRVSVTPTVAIENAFIYYSNNVTSGQMKSLGDLPAGESTVIFQANLIGGPDIYGDDGTGHRPTYMLIGLYDDGNGPGVVVSFPNADPVLLHQQWADFFESSPRHWHDYSEATVIGYLQTAAPWNDSYYRVEDFLFQFGDSGYDYFGHPCATEYAQQATLVGFSEATNLGTMTVEVPAPEPAAWVLLVGAAGAMLFWRRDLLAG